MQNIQPRIGYLLLYFLKVWGRGEEKREGEQRFVEMKIIQIMNKSMFFILLIICYSNVLNDVKASVYKDFCAHREKKLDACLVSDLKVFK